MQAANQQVTASLREAAASLRSAGEGVLSDTQQSLDSYMSVSQEQQQTHQQANQELIDRLQGAAEALQSAGIHVSGSWREAADNRVELQRDIAGLREVVEHLSAILEEFARPGAPSPSTPEDPPTD